IRGVAALGVVYTHTQNFGKQRLAFRAFDQLGLYGVIMFFVLSAFLLTLRSLLDWEKYREKREEKKNTDLVMVNKLVHLESGVGLEPNLSKVPLLSLTDSDNIFAHFGAFLASRYQKPAIGAWIGRIIANVILVTIRTEFLAAHSENYNKNKTKFYVIDFWGAIHIFLTGSICAIWYREIIRLGLLPLSLEEEDTLTNKSNNCNIPTRLSFVELIISKLPSRHQFARYFFDFGCYLLVLLKFCTMPHLTRKFFGLRRTNEIIIERQYFGGLLDAILILFGLLSRKGSFVKALSCSFLRFCGQISFSIYLLHPLAMALVNEYVPSIGYKAAKKKSNRDEKADLILDAVMLSFVTTIILSWIYFKCVERPFMNLTNYIAKKWLSEGKFGTKTKNFIDRKKN
ncbi:22249_t:CDS:2, partial [Racocetra persica]